MSVNKIFAFTIVAILVVLEHGHSCAGQQFTVNQVLGRWYYIAETVPVPNTPCSHCVTGDVTPSDDDEFDIKVEFHRIINGVLNTEIGHDKFVGDLFYGFYPARPNPNTIVKVTSYNNGQELILESQPDNLYKALASRTTTASPQTIATFETLAADVDVPVVFIPHDECDYNEDGSGRKFGPKQFKQFKKH